MHKIKIKNKNNIQISKYSKVYIEYNMKNYSINIKNISHYGDVLAIPFFALLMVYFNNIKEKSTLEYVLFSFAISGFLLDIIYTYMFWFH
jgi:hypothetical protein